MRVNSIRQLVYTIYICKCHFFLILSHSAKIKLIVCKYIRMIASIQWEILYLHFIVYILHICDSNYKVGNLCDVYWRTLYSSNKWESSLIFYCVKLLHEIKFVQVSFCKHHSVKSVVSVWYNFNVNDNFLIWVPCR